MLLIICSDTWWMLEGCVLQISYIHSLMTSFRRQASSLLWSLALCTPISRPLQDSFPWSALALPSNIIKKWDIRIWLNILQHITTSVGDMRADTLPPTLPIHSWISALLSSLPCSSASFHWLTFLVRWLSPDSLEIRDTHGLAAFPSLTCYSDFWAITWRPGIIPRLHGWTNWPSFVATMFEEGSFGAEWRLGMSCHVEMVST